MLAGTKKAQIAAQLVRENSNIGVKSITGVPYNKSWSKDKKSLKLQFLTIEIAIT
jgi:hypothetical protein